MRWSRIEAMGRDLEIDEGVAARFADPLWLIGRQWQLGELDGDDAAQPAAVRFAMREAPIVSYSIEAARASAPSPDTDLRRPLPNDVPLETLIESAPEPSSGYAGLHRSIRAGQRLTRQLSAAGLSPAISGLRSKFDPSVPGPDAPRLPATAGAMAALLARRGIDGTAVAAAPDRERRDALADLSDDDRDEALDIIRGWAITETDVATDDAWSANRFEHQFSVAADDDGVEVVLRADEHQGGRVDWHSFDVDTEASGSPPIPDVDRSSKGRRGTAIATPVRFAGMPASRWWEFEDGEVNFGDLDAGPGDLARLAVAEFAAVYNDDWFMIPARARRASLLRVESLDVFDTFGRKHTIHPASVIDHELAERTSDGAGDRRAWRFFELTGDTHAEEGRAPWMLLSPSLSTTLHGPEIERVVFARDEDANLAWAIERLVEGPLGRPLDRASVWAGHTSPTDSESDDMREPRRYGDEHWRWELETSPPPWWIPMIPERQNAGSEQVRLRRARMATWQQHAPSDVGPKGELLEPSGPFHVYEEEVPRSGATVTRSWQWARWQDGSTHLWLQRRKRNGRGERSSGLEWDVLHDVAGAAPVRSRDDAT